MEGWDHIYYALIILAHFWFQSSPYADINGDGLIDVDDVTIIQRIAEGDIWIAKYRWLCENTYIDGSTELVEGWTYTVWETEPLKYDRNPEIRGFNWTDQWNQSPLAEMNYLFFEEMFPDLIVEDANEPLYVELPFSQAPPPVITKWEIVSSQRTGGEELWQPIENGYVESRVRGIDKIRIWFDQPMNPEYNEPNMILVTSESDGRGLYPCSVDWEQWDCAVIDFCSPLPDKDTYKISINTSLWSTRGNLLDEPREICVTALRGDVDSDRSVTILDVLAVKENVGLPVEHYNSKCDINVSGAINSQDMLVIYDRLGSTAPSCTP
jgi:hypothetical protein